MNDDQKNGSLAAIEQAIPYVSSIIEPFLQQNPWWRLIFYSATGLFGVYMAFNQDEVNNFVKYISEHPEEFRKEIVESEEFKKGFLNSFESYLKVRNAKKRASVQRILIGFTVSKEKEKFEIERLNQVLFQISIEGMQYLDLIDKEILPVMDKAINDEILRVQKNSPKYNAVLAKESLRKSQPLTKYLYQYHYKDYDINSPDIKERDGYHELTEPEKTEWIDKISSQFLPIKSSFQESISELVSLGILHSFTNDHGIGSIGGGSISNEANLTKFGYQFLDFIKTE